MIINVKNGTTCRYLNWSKSKRIIIKIQIILQRYLFCDSFFTSCYYVNIFSATQDMLKHGLLNTRSYMSHLKAKIKTPVFWKNSTKHCVFSYFSHQKTMPNIFQNKSFKKLILKILKWNHLLLYLKISVRNCVCY